VQFQHVPAAGRLVQAVDVLRNDGLQLAAAFERRKRCVRLVRLCVQIKHFGSVEIVKRLRMRIKEVAAQNRFGRVGVLRIIQAARASEVRYAACGRNAGAAQKNDIGAFVDHFLKSFNIFFHLCCLNMIIDPRGLYFN
jgi:hypothetical protein